MGWEGDSLHVVSEVCLARSGKRRATLPRWPSLEIKVCSCLGWCNPAFVSYLRDGFKCRPHRAELRAIPFFQWRSISAPCKLYEWFSEQIATCWAGLLANQAGMLKVSRQRSCSLQKHKGTVTHMDHHLVSRRNEQLLPHDWRFIAHPPRQAASWNVACIGNIWGPYCSYSMDQGLVIGGPLTHCFSDGKLRSHTILLSQWETLPRSA